MSERTSYAPGTPCWVELSGTPDIEASGELLRRAVRLGDARAAELGRTGRLPAGEKRTARTSPASRRGCRTGQPTGLGDLRLGRGRRRRPRRRSREAGGRSIAEPMDVMGLGTMARLHRPDRRRLRHLAARHLRRRRAGQRVRRLRLERARHPRHRRRQGVLRRRLRLGARGQDIGRGGHLHGLEGRRGDGRRHDRHQRGRRARRGAAALARLLHGRGHRRRAGDGQGRRRRGHASARSTSRSAASPSSPTRSAPSSR